MKSMKMLLKVLTALSALSRVSLAANKTLIDYFLPMPIQGQLTRNAWGAITCSRAILRTAWKTPQ